MLHVTVTITGSKEVRQKLTRLGRDLNDHRAAMSQIGQRAADYFANQGFASQGGVFGSVWPRLKPRYAVRKAMRYPGRPPLVATGHMRDSFTSKAGSQSVTISNTAPYFVYHQSTAPRKVLPRRQMMGINQPLMRIVQEEIKDSITKKIRTA